MENDETNKATGSKHVEDTKRCSKQRKINIQRVVDWLNKKGYLRPDNQKTTIQQFL